MNITIKTLEVKEATRSVPLTKAIVKQLPYFDIQSWKQDDINDARIVLIGEVSLHDEVLVLINTPHGAQAMNRSNFWGFGLHHKLGTPERLILLK